MATYHLCSRQTLLSHLASRSPVDTHSTQRMEAIIRQNEHSSMISLEVVYLFAKTSQPKIFAEELDYVQRGLGARCVG